MDGLAVVVLALCAERGGGVQSACPLELGLGGCALRYSLAMDSG